MNKHDLIATLGLEPHREGGYFRRSYSAPHSTLLPGLGKRLFMSSIYYLLTDDSPTGYFHRNRSDIVHYWQGGESLTYYLISPQGEWKTAVLGPALAAGESLQLVVPGGFWKATRLITGEYGLLSEAVCPGFEMEDCELADSTALASMFPQLWQARAELLDSLCKP